ncbi:endonuclease MutS2 [Holzapfeliella floricola]|nr:endonuclease MutS2 [Holzapfeliella floricola]
MNSKILKTLEFDKITSQLSELTVTDNAQNKARNLLPHKTYQGVKDELVKTLDAVNLLRIKGRLPIVAYQDISPIIKRLKLEKATLNAKELSTISLLLLIMRDILTFLNFNPKDYELGLNALMELIEDVELPLELTKRLEKTFDSEGNVLDTASQTLKSIRHHYQKTEDNIRQQMEAYLKGSTANYLSEAIITIRDNRLVLPVKASYRGKFGGIVHDQSATGQTLFIEPGKIVDLNNNLQELTAREKMEIRRILDELTNWTREEMINIQTIDEKIASLDFIQAKALLANQMKAVEPIINNKHAIKLNKARHPLIDPEKVVANDIILGKDYDFMLITGPNTGGKTISLKTVGLLQLMAQSGLFISAKEYSEVGVFSEIFADIGDEQSIEQNLSTFSSHMDNIINIMSEANQDSLILLDELGSGTDPEEGSDLAISILDHFKKLQVKLMATTHYPELKLYAYNRDRTTNASMEFDVESLSPTYHLLLGVPGYSNAFEIAKRLGMPIDVIEQAKSLRQDQSSDLNDMIKKLADETKKATELKEDFEQKVEESKDIYEKLNQGLDFYHRNVNREIEQAKEKADERLKKAQQQADDIIKTLQVYQQQARSKVDVKEDQLIAAKGQLNQLRDSNLKQNKVLRREKKKQVIKQNDQVKVLAYGQIGTVTKLLGNDHFEVQIGVLKVKVSSKDLEKISQSKAAKSSQPKQQKIKKTRSINLRSTRASLDLRGQRYDEAMMNLDRYIDEALLSNFDSVTIIHGIGTGAIRSGVNQYLKRNSHVKNFGYAPEGNGGSGATIVEFK